MRLLLMGYGRHCSEVRPHMCADAGCSPGIAVSVAGAQLAGSPNAEGEALHRVCCEMWQRDGSSQPSASRCYTAVRVWACRPHVCCYRPLRVWAWLGSGRALGGAPAAR